MNKFWLAILILLLTASFSISSECKIIIVDPDRDEGDFETLGSAVASANPGDKINIRSGTYRGGVIIDRKISIYGEPGQVILAGGEDNILRVVAPGCEISNISIKGGGDDVGVLLESSDNKISDCTILDCSTGVLITGDDNSIRDNLIDSKCGISLNEASGNKIIDNTFQGDLGVRLLEASDNVVERCNFFASTGTELIGSSENLLEDNSFDCLEKAVILDGSLADRIIRNSITGGSGISITDSEKSKVSENNISDCQIGLKIINTVAGNLTDNNIIGCFVGLDIDNSSQNMIARNTIVGCSAGVGAMDCKIGIRLKNSDNNSLLGNELEQSEIAGIYLENSRYNQLQDNLAVRNGNGLLLKYAGENKLDGNRASLNEYGITLTKSSMNILQNNVMVNNTYNLRIKTEGSVGLVPGELPTVNNESAFIQMIDRTNTVDGKPVCYLVGESNYAALEDFGFIGLVGCHNVSVSGQRISNSSVGILVVNSTDCKVYNCTLWQSEIGIYLLESEGFEVEMSKAFDCDTGFSLSSCLGGILNRNVAENCSDAGFKLEGLTNVGLNGSTAFDNKVGISLLDSRYCWIARCNAFQNSETGIRLIRSSDCILTGNDAMQNVFGISLSSSDRSEVLSNNVSMNENAGIVLEQLSGGTVIKNTAIGNRDGIFVQSTENAKVERNNLSLNRYYGLRMSYSTDCEVSENDIFLNDIAGASLIDCRDNKIYHNCFLDNGYNQNAIDNGDNQWDMGPTIGGNFWSDHDAPGNPGTLPRKIPSKAVDRYPFQDPSGWNDR